MSIKHVIEHIPLSSILSREIKCNEVKRKNTDKETSEYYDLYTFSTFVHLCDDAKEIEIFALSDYDFQSLKKFCSIYQGLGLNVDDEQVQNLDVYPKLVAYMNKHTDTGVFFKVADASPKDGTDLLSQINTFKPLFSPEELFHCLIRSKRVYTFLTYYVKSCEMVLRPWNPKISPHNEYRVFVTNKKCVAISQQHLYRVIHPTLLPEQIIDFVCDWVDHHELPQPDSVLDVYVDEEGCHLIECNPAWWGSGSSLFLWDQIRDFSETVHMRLTN